MNKAIIAERLRMLRILNKLTEEEAAEELGMKIKVYKKYENGRANYELDPLMKIAQYYFVTLDYVAGNYTDGINCEHLKP